jgi:hypothetical protein
MDVTSRGDGSQIFDDSHKLPSKKNQKKSDDLSKISKTSFEKLNYLDLEARKSAQAFDGKVRFLAKEEELSANKELAPREKKVSNEEKKIQAYKKSASDQIKNLNLDVGKSAANFDGQIRAFHKGEVYTAGNKLDVNSEVLNPERGSINSEEVLSKTSKHVRFYTGKEIRKLYTYKKNGFEFGSSPEDLKKVLAEYTQVRTHPPGSSFIDLMVWESSIQNIEPKLIHSIENMLMERAKKQGRSCDLVFSFGFDFRDQTPSNEYSRKPLPIVHVDYAKNEENLSDQRVKLKNFLKTHFGRELSDKELDTIEVTTSKIWIMASKETPESVLALLDLTHLNQEKDLVPAKFEGVDFISHIVKNSKEHQYVAQANMVQGDCITFDQNSTAHAAVKIPRPEAVKGVYRQSIELGFMEIKLPPGFQKLTEQK